MASTHTARPPALPGGEAPAAAAGAALSQLFVRACSALLADPARLGLLRPDSRKALRGVCNDLLVAHDTCMLGNGGPGLRLRASRDGIVEGVGRMLQRLGGAAAARTVKLTVMTDHETNGETL